MINSLEYKRLCHQCNKQLFYKRKSDLNKAIKNQKTCKSCATKNEYYRNPNKNIGPENGRYGKTFRETLTNKYGKNIADQKMLDISNHMKSKSRFGKNNHQYGKSPHKYTGIGYSGQYKTLFFRSCLELMFIMDYEIKNGVLPINAETKNFMAIKNNKTYKPDFYCEKTNSIIEIKPSQLLNYYSDKIIALQEMCKNKHMNFVVITEKDINLYKTHYYAAKLMKILYMSKQITLSESAAKRISKRFPNVK